MFSRNTEPSTFAQEFAALGTFCLVGYLFLLVL